MIRGIPYRMYAYILRLYETSIEFDMNCNLAETKFMQQVSRIFFKQIQKKNILLYIPLFLFLISFQQVFPLYLLNQLYVSVIHSFPLIEVVYELPLQLSVLYRVWIFVTNWDKIRFFLKKNGYYSFRTYF